MNSKIREAINILKTERPIFHSEDDFKFDFSRVLYGLLGDNYELRLERPQDIKMINRDGSIQVIRAPIDIIVINKKENIIYPIELKYKTNEFTTNFCDENYKLKKHGAPDIGRFNFRKDIYRIEQLIHHSENTIKGYFIVITNENEYLQDISTKNNLDKHYSFHQDAELHKDDLGWNYEKQLEQDYILDSNQKLIKNNKIHWTSIGNEFHKLDLKNTYKIKWDIYSQIDKENFHISIVEIG